MLRLVFSAMVGFAVLSTGPARAEDQAPAAAAPVVAVVEPATSAPSTVTSEPAAAAPPTAKIIAIEPDPTAPAASTTATDAEPAAPAGPPPPTLTASVDLSEQRMTVMENGEFKYSWPISSGTQRYRTPTGVFRAQWSARMWHSRQYGWAPMPHAVFINGGVAVHATYATGALGSPASHGCIRLSPVNAKIFYNLANRHGMKLTEVSVHGTPKWRGPAIASRKKKRQQVVAQNDSWFWGAPPSSYGSASAYNPAFIKKKNRAPKPGLYAYRKKGSNKIVYFQQPPSSYGNGGW